MIGQEEEITHSFLNIIKEIFYESQANNIGVVNLIDCSGYSRPSEII
jgi:hypothetical protein